MDSVQKGIYTYEDGFSGINNTTLPTELVISANRVSNEAILIRLLCGTLRIKYLVGGQQKEIKQWRNYSIPGNEDNNTYRNRIIKDFFAFDKFAKTEKKDIDKYLISNRKNHFIHEQLLSELTSAMIWLDDSPIESFVHIYRALEFMSYSFPLIYASKSKDYRGTYEKLKSFMSGVADGELKFFKTFLAELFKGNILFQYEFDIFFMNGNESLIQAELGRIIPNPYYTFDGNTMKIKFANVADLLITLRNRYFHMLVGKGTDNFYDTRYDKREIFQAMNPVFLNWLTMIYKEIVIYSVGIL